MDHIERPLSPHLQVYRWQITMVLSILHRTTGVLLATGIVMLVGWLVAAASGPEAYTQLRNVLGSLPGIILLIGITFSFSFHFCNGIRHLFWDAGMGFEKLQYRATGWAAIIVSLLLTTLLVAIGFGVFAGGGA